MLVWSPNHCVSDAKREWVGARLNAHPWALGAGTRASLYPEAGWRLSGWVRPLPWGSGLEAYPCMCVYVGGGAC